ncbi:hypothetical protein NC969_01445 [Leptolyngbya subtilissima ST-M1]
MEPLLLLERFEPLGAQQHLPRLWPQSRYRRQLMPLGLHWTVQGPPGRQRDSLAEWVTESSHPQAGLGFE